ncbi:3-oxoacyl-[acyl-carrier protein] reductase [Larkinella arboricola]|uniref:3-oxoacyl-[acyl-carrier protein] reductase n=1 Tax=Larkinella arboricola TaxID=643671 RepID=A0A327WNV8_LARAB|nr:3-oxoacyl-ACP reductase family protein [Larkinella arboricola]RAJ92257.1 3-oxoacyl-[acyl-carrier protein] reductase [Larkinella arboricola]
MNLKDKVALVTGSSKGIGAGIAKALAKAGAKVVINYVSSKEGGDRVVDEITQNGGTAIAIQADITRSADVKRLFEKTKNAFGRLDILVNNAGVYKLEPLEAVTEDSFYAQVNTHFLGNVLCTQHAVDLFGDDGGSIINISSTVSQNPVPGTMVYSAAKAGVDTMTKVLAKELGAKKIRVNTIAPGMTETEGTREAIRGSDLEKQMLAITPLGRLGQPEDIAKVAVFLASDEAAWVTGERITVAGGLL